MAANSAQIEQVLSITGSFSLITGAAVLTDSSDWGSIGVATPDTVKILLQIYDSTGDVFYENAGYAAGVFTSPDFDLTDTTYSFTLPTDIAGDYLQGQYLIKAKVQVVEDTETTVVNKDFYQTVCACCNDIVIEVQGSNTQGTTEVKLTDNTNYKTYTELSRVMILYPPPPSGQASQTGTNVDTIIYSGTVYTGVWTWKITSDVTFTDVDGTATTCRLTGQGTFNIQQSQLCKVRCILEKERAKVFSALSQKNNAILLQNYLLAMTEYQFARETTLCGGDQSVIDAHIAKAYSFLSIDPNCDCGCGDGTSQPLLATTTVDGTDGTDGTIIYSGTTVPSGGLGVVGDFYFDTVTKYLYKKTGATTWTFQFSCAGSAGPAGENGASILANQFPNLVTLTTSFESLLEGRTPYVLPADTLNTDGDTLTGYFQVQSIDDTNTDIKRARMLFNGDELIIEADWIFLGNGVYSATVWFVITRVDDTTINFSFNVNTYGEVVSGGRGRGMTSVSAIDIAEITSLNLFTTPYNIDVQGLTPQGAGTLKCTAFELVYSHYGNTQSVGTSIQYIIPFTTTAGTTVYPNIIGAAGKTVKRVYLDGVLLVPSDWSYNNATDTLTFTISITGASEVEADYI